MKRPGGASDASPPHSHAAAPSSAVQNAIQPGCASRKRAEPNTASSTAAVSVRVLSIEACVLPRRPRKVLRDPPPAGAVALHLLDLLAGAPEAPLALLVPLDRRFEL